MLVLSSSKFLAENFTAKSSLIFAGIGLLIFLILQSKIASYLPNLYCYNF